MPYETPNEILDENSEEDLLFELSIIEERKREIMKMLDY